MRNIGASALVGAVALACGSEPPTSASASTSSTLTTDFGEQTAHATRTDSGLTVSLTAKASGAELARLQASTGQTASVTTVHTDDGRTLVGSMKEAFADDPAALEKANAVTHMIWQQAHGNGVKGPSKVGQPRLQDELDCDDNEEECGTGGGGGGGGGPTCTPSTNCAPYSVASTVTGGSYGQPIICYEGYTACVAIYSNCSTFSWSYDTGPEGCQPIP